LDIRIKLRRKARHFAGKLTSLPISVGYGGAGLKLSDLRPQTPSVHALKRELDGFLESRPHRTRNKIIILIDNLDRLPPNEILLMLKLIRLCSDFRDFVYVIAFDDKYVIDAINEFVPSGEHALGGGEYLRKIIQTDLHLPAIELSSIDDFVNKAFAELQEAHEFEWPEDFSQRFPHFYQTNLRGRVIKNLRDAKKLANAAAFTLPLIIGELNHADWLVTEVLRVFDPSTYELVRMNIDALCPDYSSLGFRWSGFERSRWHHRYQSIQESIHPAESDLAVAALDFLFPVFASWRANPSNPSTPGAYDMGNYSREQRIASPDYKYAYFQFGPEPTRIPDSRVSDFIEQINGLSGTGCVEFVVSFLNQLKEEGFLKDLLDKLVLRADTIVFGAQISLVRSLANQSALFSKRESILMDSEEARSQALIFSVAANNEVTGKAQEILELAIQEAAEDSYAVDIVLFSAPERNRILRDFSAIDNEKLKDRLKERLRSRYSGVETDVFKTEPDAFGYILFQWAGPLLCDRDAVVDYLDGLFTSSPAYVGKFLSSFVSSDPMTTDDARWTFDMQRFQDAFDPSWMMSHIGEMEEALYTTEKERWGVAQFSELTISSAS
jgi:hypothetical protein